MRNKTINFEKQITVSGANLDVILNKTTTDADWCQVDVIETDDNFVCTFSAEENQKLSGRTNTSTLKFNAELDGEEILETPLTYNFICNQTGETLDNIQSKSERKLNAYFRNFDYYTEKTNEFYFVVSATSVVNEKFLFNQLVPSAQTITISEKNYNTNVSYSSSPINEENTTKTHKFTMNITGDDIEFSKSSTNFSNVPIDDDYYVNAKVNDGSLSSDVSLNNLHFKLTQDYVSYKYNYNGLNYEIYYKGAGDIACDKAIKLPSYVRQVELVSYDKDAEKAVYSLTDGSTIISAYTFDATTDVFDYVTKPLPENNTYDFLFGYSIDEGQSYNYCKMEQYVEDDEYVVAQCTQDSSAIKNLVPYNPDLFTEEVQNIEYPDYTAGFDDIVESNNLILISCNDLLTTGISLEKDKLYSLNLVVEQFGEDIKEIVSNYTLSRHYVVLDENGLIGEETEELSFKNLIESEDIKVYLTMPNEDNIYLYLSGNIFNECEKNMTSYYHDKKVYGKDILQKSVDDFNDGVIIFYELSSGSTIEYAKAETYAFENVNEDDEQELQGGISFVTDETTGKEKIFTKNKIRFLKVFKPI